MADTTTAPSNKSIAFRDKPARELSGAAKSSTVRKSAKKMMRRGLISEKAAAKHLSED